MLRRTLRLQASRSWSDTLRLPRSTFPPRPLVAQRSKYLQQCTDDLYSWQSSQRSVDNQFVLHDGPPYANGSLHAGHALNKITKDIISRFHLSQGKRVHYVPGWDCHGLPIEVKALQNADDHRKMRPADIRKAARALALKTVKEQKEGFKEWAILGDWERPYATLDHDYEVRQLEIFQNMVAKGLIYRQHKPVYWSPSSGTALAEAELEYDENHISLSAFVKFEMQKLTAPLASAVGQAGVSAMIWTTTPWTLPANRAIAVNNEIKYCLFRRFDDKQWILTASSLLDNVLTHAGLSREQVEVMEELFTGQEIVGSHYINPLQGRTRALLPILHADFVSESSGTGLVHTAPGHGFDDYNVCLEHGIKGDAPVDDNGDFTISAYPDDPSVLRGVNVLDTGSHAVLSLLCDRHGLHHVWATHQHTHKYPIDWRTKQPVIIRATEQWFADVGSIKQKALDALDKVEFIPSAGVSRLSSFIASRSQWCISRQRAWGVPIPALYRVDESTSTQTAILTGESVSHIIKIISERGTDAWWNDEIDDPIWLHATLPPGKYVRGRDTMDVWFDSGTSWTLLPDAFKEDACADVYLEGTDQHRGWFQSSLLTRIASQNSSDRPSAPFKTLITHGFLLDGDGRKMSKSLGNVVSPGQIMDGSLLPPVKSKKTKKHPAADPTVTYDAMGPDALRLWVASSDYTRDVSLGLPVLAAVNGSLHKYRVTLRFLLGILSDFDAAALQQVQNKTLDLKDRIAQNQLARTARAVHAAYCTFEPFKAVNVLNKFIVTDLSAFYLETSKDPLYAGLQHDRLAAQATCFKVFHSLLSMLAPITPLLVAETLDHTSESLQTLISSLSLHPFRDVWQPEKLYFDPYEEAKTSVQAEWLIAVHNSIKGAQEEAREKKLMASGLECRVSIHLPMSIAPEIARFFQECARSAELVDAFVVQRVDVELVSDPDKIQRSEPASAWQVDREFTIFGDTISRGRVFVTPADQQKCPRCWRYSVSQEQPEDSICGRCEQALRESS